MLRRAPSSAARLHRGGFSADVTNPWFPLTPGTTYTYDGIKDGKRSHETLTVTSRVKVIRRRAVPRRR